MPIPCSKNPGNKLIIACNKNEKNVATRREDEDYRIVYNKCVIVNNFDTLPLAFKFINRLF